jgi:GNAT superfamily N-acetyltransferase
MPTKAPAFPEKTPAKQIALTFLPATPDRWSDVEKLFGERGACGGCWCMSWRLLSADFDAGKGEGNMRALRKLVKDNRVPGILAYDDGRPVAWCSVAPREEFVRLEKHRTLSSNKRSVLAGAPGQRIDDHPVWSIVCLFIDKPHRRQGVSATLLKAAAKYAFSRGARIVEGYPTAPNQVLPDPFIFMGTDSAFRKAGFTEVARPAKTRLIMRLEQPK